ncbi:MAG TPA: ABC-type transport auxiliary lipoprotein family protein [Beijerinckiaceae bacterium]|nr:ABC-type transport auxiliary lipoprotein family protein [Beijerinckiaceae bacterium]
MHGLRLGAIGGRRAAFALAGALVLAGCATASPPATFDLSAPRQGFAAPRAKGILVVEEPSASAPDDSDRIVVRTGPDSIAFLRGAQWVDSLPNLVQARLIESFENAHLIRSVARPSDSVAADYKLITSVRRFDITAGSGEAVVQISAKLADDHSGRVLAGKIFTGQALGSAGQGASATHALDEALAQVMKQIVAWSAERMRTSHPAS